MRDIALSSHNAYPRKGKRFPPILPTNLRLFSYLCPVMLTFSPMIKILLLIILLAFFLSSCGVVPLTGRRQILLVSDQEVLSSSLTQYKDYIKAAPKSSSAAWSAMVTRVGKNIAAATTRYLRQNGLSGEIKNFSWEFNLVKDDQVNAFCMPGGKIVVYEGLMKIISSDDELAVVLGHEVAHALTQYGAQILNHSLSEKNIAVQKLAGIVYGVGTQVGVMLPFSRKHESEADYMGLILMKMAGYNPDVAVAFWQKMASGSTGAAPALLSTHPSDAQRIRDIRKALPEIKAKY